MEVFTKQTFLFKRTISFIQTHRFFCFLSQARGQGIAFGEGYLEEKLSWEMVLDSWGSLTIHEASLY